MKRWNKRSNYCINATLASPQLDVPLPLFTSSFPPVCNQCNFNLWSSSYLMKSPTVFSKSENECTVSSTGLFCEWFFYVSCICIYTVQVDSTSPTGNAAAIFPKLPLAGWNGLHAWSTRMGDKQSRRCCENSGCLRYIYIWDEILPSYMRIYNKPL